MFTQLCNQNYKQNTEQGHFPHPKAFISAPSWLIPSTLLPPDSTDLLSITLALSFLFHLSKITL